MNWQTEYTARFAPIEEWHLVQDLEERFSESAFRDQGLTKRPETTRTIPVLLRHEKEKVVGVVEAVWPAQGWWHARFKLNASLNLTCLAADYVQVGTPVSPSFLAARWTDNGIARRYDRAWLNHLALHLPPNRPAYKGAEVTFIVGRDLPSGVDVDRLLEGAREQVIHHSPGTKLVRREIGSVLRVS